MGRALNSRKRQGAFRQLLDLPLFLLIFGVASVAMLVPAIHGGASRNLETARMFFYCGLLGITFFVFVAIAQAGRRSRYGVLGSLLSLFATFVFLPAFLAIPFFESLKTTTFLNAYVEMVSALTTTGATMFDDPERLDSTLHLWRAQVGWMGGAIMWIAASAILAPLNLGGFEVTAQAEPGQREALSSLIDRADPRERLLRVATALMPIYVGLTLLLWILLMISGDTSLVGLSHAMSIMATSGISPVGGVEFSTSGITGEALMLLFMFFALSRLTFSSDTVTATQGGLRTDPEFRLGIVLVLGVPLILFIRHWLGALDVSAESQVGQAANALWGSVFTVMSFLTTTGFVSSDWAQTQAWSGLETPGLILMGLALIGGGVATTAGGVKLLRVFALYLNGLREMERLVHPSSVSSAGGQSRRLQKNGAFIAWIFFMLFALTLAVITVTLALQGVSFEDALVLSIAGLSTTGPLITFAADTPIQLVQLDPFAKAVFCAAMVLGRLETLAIIALLTPDLWRA
ncbi:potassium transporter TrkG [uncultured Roseobacter sp.]|uniref:TrkH family potassium uptake protein n=1 Tax=uncultured Roseobacter sp. TaxID=114847 RepID=UPI0026118A02|nr:potassium transporter TrkG [uncultured Roseobacter sp.]